MNVVSHEQLAFQVLTLQIYIYTLYIYIYIPFNVYKIDSGIYGIFDADCQVQSTHQSY